jgi:hypothetical protein
MNRQSVGDIVMALYGGGDPAVRLETLSRLLVDLLVEVEALRGAVAQLSVGAAGRPVHGRYDIPCHDETLVEGKQAYPAAYVDAAYVLHNAAGPTGGIEKLLARFYPANGDESRETLMLRRLGFSDAEIAQFVEAAEQAEIFT